MGSDAGAGIPYRVLTKAQWDGINAFASAAGWQIVFGLNALQGWHGPSGWEWDPSNARELMEYTTRRKFPVVGWELGNEPGLKNKNGAVQTGGGDARSRSASALTVGALRASNRAIAAGASPASAPIRVPVPAWPAVITSDIG